MKTKILKYIGVLAVAAVIFLLGAYAGRSYQGPSGSATGTASLMVDYGNGKLDIYKGLDMEPGTKVYDLLENTDLEMGYDDYGGDLGMFVKSINGVGPDPEGKKWWQYWVNNEYAKTGISSKEAKPGDVIELKFIEGQR